MTIDEYLPGTPFPGKIGRTVDQSQPAWPVPKRAKPGAPNVLFFLLDDVGFAQLKPYGGLIEVPNIERLAENGLMYTNMHTTALCSPTRACVITGRNHHSNAMGSIGEWSTGYPGYNSRVPFEHGFMSEILKEEGYNTFGYRQMASVRFYGRIPGRSLMIPGPWDAALSASMDFWPQKRTNGIRI